jgi:tripartite-type tricarboxylate transporter receptor subunit TctC
MEFRDKILNKAGTGGTKGMKELRKSEKGKVTTFKITYIFYVN